MGETNQISFQGILYLVHKGTISTLSDSGGEDGAKGGLHRVQKYGAYGFGASGSGESPFQQ